MHLLAARPPWDTYLAIRTYRSQSMNVKAVVVRVALLGACLPALAQPDPLQSFKTIVEQCRAAFQNEEKVAVRLNPRSNTGGFLDSQ
jgi:hypothetical protein